MWYVVLINVIKIGGCVVLCLGIGVCKHKSGLNNVSPTEVIVG